jgi:hypothetical protein
MATLVAASNGGPGLEEEEESGASVLARAKLVPRSSIALRQRIGTSVRRGELNPHRALLATQHVDREVRDSAAACASSLPMPTPVVPPIRV